jgi:hypothetical protein
VTAGGTAGQILAKNSGTDYDTGWIDNYTSQVKHLVKAGEALTKGQAVYVSSANGTNIIVSKASNASEGTSSKTMGLIDSTLSTNGISYVIAEGLLAGLNTSTATAGDPVWLGTSGNLIYGLASKPVAPAHLVFIGIVTRVSATVGEIWVKVQNGFELDELHNVLITSPADKQVLKYDAATSLWKNGVASGGVTASATAPSSPNAGDAWLDTNTGVLYVWYVDANSSQWIQANNGTIRDTALTNRVTTLETNVRSVPLGGTGASSLTSGSYLKGAGTGAITAQTGIPATDVTSGVFDVAVMPAGSVIQAQYYFNSTYSAFATGSLTDVSSSLRLNFTPKLSNSKMIIICAMNWLQEGTHRQVVRLLRNGSVVGNDMWWATAVGGWTSAVMNHMWEDSASHTANTQVTYSFQTATSANNMYYNYNFDGQPGSSNYVIFEVKTS